MEQETIMPLIVVFVAAGTGFAVITLFEFACDLVVYAGEYLFLGEEK
jgi:hypothetical protein